MKKIHFPYIPIWQRTVALVLVLIFIVGFLAVGWIFSSKIITVNLQKIEYDQSIASIDDNKYTMSGGAYDINGIVGGIRDDGSMIGIFSAPLNKDDASKTSTRVLANLASSKPVVGQKLSLQGNIWTTDPKQALGLEFRDIKYDGPLGSMSAWLVPFAESTKWTIGVHGIGGDKQELLRFIKPVHEAGNNMMIINYRNDRSNPRSPDGYFHLGDSEWQDLEAAVRYARANGASEIQLYGVSLGGSITENYLKRSRDVENSNIKKVILDSPALDWEEILRFRAKKAGYPSFVYFPARVVTKLRTGVDISKISTYPEDVKHKTLIIHNVDDPSVPQAASKRMAEAKPDLVQLVDFGAGGHIRAWNYDQLRYEQLINQFLAN